MTRRTLARRVLRRLGRWYRLATQTAHLMVGLPDYATYVFAGLSRRCPFEICRHPTEACPAH